uniref:tRNA/rRNA methyltransferase SpoU type domain-containing protein n=1 Tax=Trypanosoma congolense (strain IL3000) TaxID=1068625 RepID=G0UQF6_TRYCI|nr:conserved hypothetical protein [Trypanosoma congolense IL3000]
MLQWGHPLCAVNKAVGRRWSPIPKPPPPNVDRLCGTHSVLNSLRVFYSNPRKWHPHRRQLHCLYLRDFRVEAGDDAARDAEEEVDVALGAFIPSQYTNTRKIVRLARALDVPINLVKRRELVLLCGERRNQNVVLEVASFLPKDAVACPWAYDREKWLEDKEDGASCGLVADDVIFLDHVMDPANVGAIMRTAFFMGLRRVVLGSDSAACTAAVCRASAGFLEYMSVYRSAVPTVTFIENTIAQHEARHDGYGLEIYATSTLPPHGTSERKEIRHSAPEGMSVAAPRRRLLILGNEGAGLPREVTRLCTHAVHVPLVAEAHSPAARLGFLGEAKPCRRVRKGESSSPGGSVDEIALLRREEVSLNVSAASALILSALRMSGRAVDVHSLHQINDARSV